RRVTDGACVSITRLPVLLSRAECLTPPTIRRQGKCWFGVTQIATSLGELAKWRQYTSSTNFRIKRYEGPATIRGDWICFDGKKKSLLGKFLEIEILAA